MNILLVVGTAKDVFIYNMAKWLKASINVKIDVFQLYPSEQQQYDYKCFDNVASVSPNWCTDLRGVRILTSSFREAQELDRFLQGRHYDIIQCHWIRPATVISKNLRKNCDKLFATFWGREYASTKICFSKKLYRYKLNQFLNNIDYLMNSPILLNTISPKYPQIKDKFRPAILGAAPLDYLYDLMKKQTKDENKQHWDIPEDKYSVLIGYSGKPLHQHLKVIKYFVKNEKFKSKVHLLAVMTRGFNSDYTQEVEEALKSSGYSYTMIKDRFLMDEEIASLRYATDITLQLSTTDAFSRSIVECLCAQSVVIYGSWLNYDKHLSNENFQAIPAKTFDNGFMILDQVVERYDSYLPMTINNARSGKQHTWAECIKDWVHAYQIK